MSNVDIALVAGTDDLLVTFDLARDGTPTAGYNAVERGYRTDGTTQTSFVADLTGLTDLGGGSYSITVPDGNLVEGNNRYLFRVAIDGDRDSRVYFYGDYPASPFEGPAAVSAQACTNCHGPEGIDVHGGYFAADDGAEPCLVCHGVFGFGFDIPSLGEAAHKYHNGIWEDDGEFVEVTFPTYMTNCSVCHSEPAELTAANSMPVSAGCFTCHGTMASWTEYFQPDPDAVPPKPDLSIHFALTPTPETADCSSCHNPTGIAANKLVVTDSHNGLRTERGGVIVAGTDTSVVEGEKFAWEITGVVDDGVNLAITWQASYNDVGVDPCNATVGAGAPVFFVNNRLRFYRSYAQGDDFIIGMSTSSPGQALNVTLSADNTTCVGNIATTTIPVDDVVAEKGRLALGGKPLVLSEDDPTLTVAARVPTPTYDWLVGDGTAAPMRRHIVDTGECLKCHVGSLYQHGGDRVDNVDMCLVCHNAASNEKNVRVSTMGIDPADTYDGRAGQTFEMKSMLHRIHSAGVAGQPPIVIYRGRGVYAFGPDRSGLANWPGEGDQVVFGSTIDNDGNPGSFVTNHHFHAPTFPRSVNDCAACHVEGSVDFQPDQTKAMASTDDAGGTDYANQLDDVLQGAATTACVTCHASGPAKGHAYQNSWQPQEFEEGRQTIIDAVN